MPIYRGPDGKIVEDNSVSVNPKQAEGHETVPVVELPKVPDTGVFNDSANDNKTIIVGTRTARSDAGASPGLPDPIVGWLVIVEGPGQGVALKLGYGNNSIGRSSTQRVQLNFGDDEISRAEHAVITYDPRGRKYYIQGGGGANLVYLGEQDEVVLAPTELSANTSILLGHTRLRFVPFCGSDFDWQDIKK